MVTPDTTWYGMWKTYPTPRSTTAGCRISIFHYSTPWSSLTALPSHCSSSRTSTAINSSHWRPAYADGVQRLDRVVERLQKPVERLPVIDFVDEELPHLTPQSNFTKQEFEEAVKKCVEYIRAGDIFQVVISQRWTLPNLCDPFEVYRTLRVINPSPFMFYVRTPSVTLVGSSPEVMCRVMGGDGDGYAPWRGTRPRGKTDKEDQQLATELLADPKVSAPNT
ncbi:MAG: hypothetical protein KatS3mg111_0954 [Pirellulaceae bacterium]|nr:MAG: hypothetical protein KatS3mg111_0954 [Pirellulaceae bacterium]